MAVELAQVLISAQIAVTFVLIVRKGWMMYPNAMMVRRVRKREAKFKNMPDYMRYIPFSEELKDKLHGDLMEKWNNNKISFEDFKDEAHRLHYYYSSTKVSDEGVRFLDLKEVDNTQLTRGETIKAAIGHWFTCFLLYAPFALPTFMMFDFESFLVGWGYWCILGLSFCITLDREAHHLGKKPTKMECLISYMRLTMPFLVISLIALLVS